MTCIGCNEARDKRHRLAAQLRRRMTGATAPEKGQTMHENLDAIAADLAEREASLDALIKSAAAEIESAKGLISRYYTELVGVRHSRATIARASEGGP